VVQYIEVWREKRFTLSLDTDGVCLESKIAKPKRGGIGFHSKKNPRWAIALYSIKAEQCRD